MIVMTTDFRVRCDWCDASLEFRDSSLDKVKEVFETYCWGVVGDDTFCPRCMGAYREIRDKINTPLFEKHVSQSMN